MKDEVISIIEDVFKEFATDESCCLLEIFDNIKREVTLLNDKFIVREPYDKDNGRFVEIELSEDEYLYCYYEWQREVLSLWWVEDNH